MMSKTLWKNIARAIGSLLLLCVTGLSAHAQTCFGKFASPVTDVCWSCMLPITIGNANTTPGKNQDDRPNPANPVCVCPTPVPPFVKVGLEVGFWEPARMFEAVRKPYCFPGLSGTDIPLGFTAPHGAQGSKVAVRGATSGSFYQAHLYVHPILYELQAMTGFDCLEPGGMDVAYITEMDPAWNDDALTLLLNPEVLLFSNLPAGLACIGDCLMSIAGMPLDPMFWCAGCHGLMFPTNGHVQAHIGGAESSSLLLTRMMFQMHRKGLAKQYWGQAAVCGPKPSPMLTKSAYKKSLVYPRNQPTIMGQCCSPLGRTSVIWGAGMEFPVKGEDWLYLIFRKRNCCATPQK